MHKEQLLIDKKKYLKIVWPWKTENREKIAKELIVIPLNEESVEGLILFGWIELIKPCKQEDWRKENSRIEHFWERQQK